MRVNEEFIKEFESIYDLKFLPGIYIVARLDGRSFSSLTNEMGCKKPFDEKFQDTMSYVTSSIITDSGFNILYGYHQSDEISLLFNPYVDSFGRRINKYVSVLSSLASSIFTRDTNKIASFDCRISHLPTINNVIDYFQWRQEDASRNCINGYCYWKLREKYSKRYANNILKGKKANEMQEILFQEGINYNDIPVWQKRGTGFYWSKKEKEGYNPLTKEKLVVERNVLHKDLDIPYGYNYGLFIRRILTLTNKDMIHDQVSHI